MRNVFLVFFLLLTGCASVTDQVPDEKVLHVSGNVYEILDVDRRGVFGSENSLKKSVYNRADKFAESKSKVASPLAARIHRVGILGDWAWFWYKFELVDIGSPASYRNITDIKIVRDARLSTDFFRERNDISENVMPLSDQIRELAKLRDEGLLTDAEFEEQKKKLLEK
jgi:hypothetical protein